MIKQSTKASLWEPNDTKQNQIQQHNNFDHAGGRQNGVGAQNTLEFSCECDNTPCVSVTIAKGSLLSASGKEWGNPNITISQDVMDKALLMAFS